MKQAKLALTAVAVLAVIGGALAFKANNVQTKVFQRQGSTTGNCIVPTTLSTAVVDIAGTTVLTAYNSVSAAGACTGITVLFQD